MLAVYHFGYLLFTLLKHLCHRANVLHVFIIFTEEMISSVNMIHINLTKMIVKQQSPS